MKLLNMYCETDLYSDNNYANSSLKKTKEFLEEEKPPEQKNNAIYTDVVLPAPFYNELHFANYE